MVEEDYTPLPPRPRSIAPEDELFSFSGSNLPPPPPAFQHAVELDPAVPFDPGLGYTTQPISEVASAPFADWDEYGEASAPPLEESDDELDASESSASVPPPPPEETERRQQ
ncbi:hypothetical protein DACRYDRAFT_21652 [Dacryopinax primogenitus]|uniref:Uncharacterized protein n=1 Tax=Dacryopinax primogenitus (strain DJM 731) TaxID=1858805 RepID=M5G2Y5_DACPD|nr:uncharacterized protein DACRYDRAFT_21652 [Dacryopinax primogenitus]EJU02590.1 hypothetical protein DACRYDRAFT_21652 [Dacryopinax primogenitus]